MKTLRQEIKELLIGEYKIFLDKCEGKKHTYHIYYYQKNEHGYFLYHIKYSFISGKQQPLFADYPTLEIPLKKKENLSPVMNKFITHIIDQMNYGYKISCNRKD